jgi:hypothetical protein
MSAAIRTISFIKASDAVHHYIMIARPFHPVFDDVIAMYVDEFYTFVAGKWTFGDVDYALVSNMQFREQLFSYLEYIGFACAEGHNAFIDSFRAYSEGHSVLLDTA